MVRQKLRSYLFDAGISRDIQLLFLESHWLLREFVPWTVKLCSQRSPAIRSLRGGLFRSCHLLLQIRRGCLLLLQAFLLFLLLQRKDFSLYTPTPVLLPSFSPNSYFPFPSPTHSSEGLKVFFGGINKVCLPTWDRTFLLFLAFKLFFSRDFQVKLDHQENFLSQEIN